MGGCPDPEWRGSGWAGVGVGGNLSEQERDGELSREAKNAEIVQTDLCKRQTLHEHICERVCVCHWECVPVFVCVSVCVCV